MKTNPIAFQARPIAIANVKVRNMSQHYKLYELDCSDRFFLQDLQDAIDIKKLYPQLNKKEYFYYDLVLRNGLSSSITPYSEFTLLANQAKEPCGFMYILKNVSEYYVKYVATWSSEPQKRPLMAGKTLFMHLFNKILENKNVKKVEIDALRKSAFNPAKKYSELGFNSIDSTNSKDFMEITRGDIEKSVGKFQDNIKITPLENESEVCLHQELKMPPLII